MGIKEKWWWVIIFQVWGAEEGGELRAAFVDPTAQFKRGRKQDSYCQLHAWETGPLYEAAWVETPVVVNKLLNLGISVSLSQLNSFKLNQTNLINGKHQAECLASGEHQ